MAYSLERGVTKLFKVFKDQTFQIIDVQINASSFTSPANTTN